MKLFKNGNYISNLDILYCNKENSEYNIKFVNVKGKILNEIKGLPNMFERTFEYKGKLFIDFYYYFRYK